MPSPKNKPHILLATFAFVASLLFLLQPSVSNAVSEPATARIDAGLYATRLVTAPASAGSAHIRSFTTEGVLSAPASGFFAYPTTHRGGARLALCDVDGDGKGEIVTGAGPGGGPQVRVFNGDGTPKPIQFFAFASTFRGGVDVGCADADADGKQEIVVSQFSGGQGWVKVYRYNAAHEILGEWNAFGAAEVGATVTGCDINGDGKDEVCVGAGYGGGPHVRVFHANGQPTTVQFFAFASSSRTGVDVAAGDTDADGRDELFVSQLRGGQALVKGFQMNAQRTVFASWNAFGSPPVGANIDLADVNGDGALDVLTGAGPGGGPQVRMFSTTGTYLKRQFFAYDSALRGGVTAVGSRLSSVDEHQSASLLPPAGLKIAFIGDASAGSKAREVLELVKDQGADAVVHAGDLGYGDGPVAWNALIDDVLGESFPYFIAAGNHDVETPGEWETYTDLAAQRLTRVPDALCEGELGTNSTCIFRGVLFAFSGIGTVPEATAAQLKVAIHARPAAWKVCVWHKNQRLMQTGGKSDEVGWDVYENCRREGAMIATAHEHEYSRTRLMEDFDLQTIATSARDVLTLQPGKTFAFVSGLGGHDVRTADPTLAAKPWWASVYSATDDADAGALFCTFHINGDPTKAQCTFRDVQGRTPDTFTLHSRLP